MIRTPRTCAQDREGVPQAGGGAGGEARNDIAALRRLLDPVRATLRAQPSFGRGRPMPTTSYSARCSGRVSSARVECWNRTMRSSRGASACSTCTAGSAHRAGAAKRSPAPSRCANASRARADDAATQTAIVGRVAPSPMRSCTRARSSLPRAFARSDLGQGRRRRDPTSEQRRIRQLLSRHRLYRRDPADDPHAVSRRRDRNAAGAQPRRGRRVPGARQGFLARGTACRQPAAASLACDRGRAAAAGGMMSFATIAGAAADEAAAAGRRGRPFRAALHLGHAAAPKGVPVNYAASVQRLARRARARDRSPSILLSAAPLYASLRAFPGQSRVRRRCGDRDAAGVHAAALAAALDATARLLFVAPAHMSACLNEGLLTPDRLPRCPSCKFPAAPARPTSRKPPGQEARRQCAAAVGMSEIQAGAYNRPSDPLEASDRRAGRPSPGTELRVADGGTACRRRRRRAADPRLPDVSRLS